jgi:two-component system nitrogen regulation sensor histidine kinase GlnL
VTEQLRIYGKGLAEPTIDGLRAEGLTVSATGLQPADAVLLETGPDDVPDLSALAMLRLEHPDAFILLYSEAPSPDRLIQWVRAGLDDWVDASGGPTAVAEALRSNVQRRRVARQQREVMQSLEDRRRRAESEERELSERMVAMATDLETEHQRLGAAHSTLQNRVAQLVMIYRIGRNLSTHRNWDEALGELLEQVSRFLGAEGVALLLRSQGGRRLAARSVYGLDESRVKQVIEAVRSTSFAESGEQSLLCLESLREGTLDACVDRRRPFSTSIVPLLHHGRDLGCLVIEKDYADGTAFADDYYFLVTIRTVVAEEVAAAQAFHELRRLQRFQERTLDHLGNGILTVDGSGMVGFANRAALELLGVDGPGEIDFDASLKLGAESPPIRRWMSSLPDSGAATIDARVYRRGTDESIPVSLVVSPLETEVPGSLLFVCVLEDGRQREALEAERRRAARQKELLIMAAEWAHDVRTPLTGILHNAELLDQALDPDSPRRRHFGVIRAEVERINGLVNHFLDYARPAQLREQVQDAGTLLEEVAGLMEGLATQREVAVHLERDGTELYASLDTDQFKQVLLNLVTNALDVAPPRSAVRVRGFSARRPEIATNGRPTDAVVVEIRDAGPGVGGSDIDRLFVPFFTTKSEGTGLGLAISDKIVRAHGGTLRYERDADETVFRIVLPRSKEGPGRDDETGSRRRGLEARG